MLTNEFDCPWALWWFVTRSSAVCWVYDTAVLTACWAHKLLQDAFADIQISYWCFHSKHLEDKQQSVYEYTFHPGCLPHPQCFWDTFSCSDDQFTWQQHTSQTETRIDYKASANNTNSRFATLKRLRYLIILCPHKPDYNSLVRADTIWHKLCNSRHILYSIFVKHNNNLWPILRKPIHECCKAVGALSIIWHSVNPCNVSKLLDSGKANNTAPTYKGWSTNVQDLQHLQSWPVNIKDDTGHITSSPFLIWCHT